MTEGNLILYKYRGYSARTLSILIDRELYFASPSELNDPHDCQLSIREALDAAIQNAEVVSGVSIQSKLQKFGTLDHIYENIEKDIRSVGVLSLSSANVEESVLMWAHYADEYRGFCLGFRFSNRFLQHNDEYAIVGCAPVIYKPVNHFYNFFLEIAKEEGVPAWDGFWTSMFDLGLRAKSTAWKHEEEVRVIRGMPGKVPFEPQELAVVIFGSRMSSENKDTIRRLLLGSDWEHVIFRQAVRRNNHELGLQIVDT